MTGENFAQRISLYPDNIQQYLPTQTLAFEYLWLLNIWEKQTEYLCKRKGECATSGLECGSASTLCHGPTKGAGSVVPLKEQGGPTKGAGSIHCGPTGAHWVLVSLVPQQEPQK